MAKSSGARPRKGVAKEVAVLRAKLAGVRSDQWAKAQVIFEEICILCGVSGPSGMTMVPRACRFCHYYGHTKQFCPARKRAEERAIEAECARIDRERVAAPTQETVSAAHWAWVQSVRAQMEIHDALLEEGWPRETWREEHMRRLRVRCPSPTT